VRLGVLVLGVVPAISWAEPVETSQPARSPSITRRSQARQELAKKGGFVKQSWWQPLPTAEAPEAAPTSGSVEVRSRGRAVVVRASIPEARNGVPGVLVHQLTAANATPVVSDETVEAPTREAMTKVLDAAARESLHVRSIQDLFGGALDQVVKASSLDKIALMRAAMDGMARKINDPWTAYYDPAAWKATKGYLSSTPNVPVGVTMKLDAGNTISLTQVHAGSAAQKAGLQAGDRLLRVGNQAVTAIPQAITELAGLPGTTVDVEIERGGARLTIPIVRAALPFVTARLEAGGLGVIRFGDFRSGTAAEVRKAIVDLETKHGTGLRGLVLDLRGNTGGFVIESARLLNTFIGSGSLGSLRTRSGQIDADYPANPSEATHAGLPLVVLVDNNTVSAPEFAASVFKDRGRAVIFGDQTYGKGVGQLNRTFADGSGLRMTATRFHVPSGAPLPHGTGVVPDVTSQTAKARAQARGTQPSDAVLDEALWHLRNGTPTAPATP
jgi:carboxyl-terminal processing protease